MLGAGIEQAVILGEFLGSPDLRPLRFVQGPRGREIGRKLCIGLEDPGAINLQIDTQFRQRQILDPGVVGLADALVAQGQRGLVMVTGVAQRPCTPTSGESASLTTVASGTARRYDRGAHGGPPLTFAN